MPAKKNTWWQQKLRKYPTKNTEFLLHLRLIIQVIQLFFSNSSPINEILGSAATLMCIT